MIYVNILVTTAMLHFIVIIVYHVSIYTWLGKVISSHMILMYSKIYGFFSEVIKSSNSEDNPVGAVREMNEIPDVTYNYHEYREPLIGEKARK